MINKAVFFEINKNEWKEHLKLQDVNFNNPTWITLDYKDTPHVESILNKIKISSTQQDALIDPEVRPRLWVTGNHQILLFLRGINLNPNSQPEDMVSVRIYFDGKSLVCFRSRNLQTISSIKQRIIESPQFSANIQQLFTLLLSEILLKIEKQVTNLANQLDELENMVEEDKEVDFNVLEDIRRTSAKLWRYLSPQKDVLAKLTQTNLNWIDTETQHQLQELEDEITFEVEELALVRERCQQLENLLSNKLSQRVNKNLYLISVITAIFIPISFLTGLLGINVGGMPGVESGAAFWVFCGILLVLAILEIIYLKKKDWF